MGCSMGFQADYGLRVWERLNNFSMDEKIFLCLFVKFNLSEN